MVEQTSLWDEAFVNIEPPSCVTDLLISGPRNEAYQETVCKCYDHIQSHEKIMCSISGGYDSDIMLDLMIRCGGKDKTTFVFNNTGLEYDATKEHIRYLEKRYGIEIVTLAPKKAIPTCCREYGVPFWSKYVSRAMSDLQRHGFEWEDKPLDVLFKKYEICKFALRWWCNDYMKEKPGISKFNIEYIRGLKEFIILNPPEFSISSSCCEWAKKRPAKDYLKAGNFDLNCVGVRKAEGGIRATKYKNCFDEAFCGADNYRPLFWWSDKDKDEYRKFFGIIRSDCYEEWGFERTGCCGCPFNKKFDEEIELVRLFEPHRYKAMLAVFGKSYDYTRRFLEFREKRKIKQGADDKDQTEIEGVR